MTDEFAKFGIKQMGLVQSFDRDTGGPYAALRFERNGKVIDVDLHLVSAARHPIPHCIHKILDETGGDHVGTL